MAKNRQSRATKIVLASLLAASLSVPTFASAKVADTTTTTISTDVKVEATAETTEGTVVKFQTFKPGTDEAGYMDKYFAGTGLLVEKDGTYTVKLTIPAQFAAMIPGFQIKQGDKYVDATIEKQQDGSSIVSFPVDPKVKTGAKVHVVASQANMDKWYDFDFQPVATTEVTEPTEEVKEEQPEKEETVVTDEEEDVDLYEGTVTVYKDGTKEESIMKNYISSTVVVGDADGTYVVGMVFPKGQYVQSFKVDGKDAVLEEEDKETNERIYTFEVKDLKALANAEIHIIVDEPAAGVKYDSVHTVQFSFNVDLSKPVTDTEETTVENPFKDIDNNENKEAILNLLAYEIIMPQDKFNPNNNLTRAQFALMIARTLELEATEVAGFQDIKGIEAENAINALAEYGIVESREKFNPNGILTRQQGALMIYRAIQAVTEGDLNVQISLPYADVATIANDEAKEAFSLLNKEGIMTGSVAKDGKTYINANKPLTRGQMAKILNNSLKFFYEFEE
ncbi:NEAT domain-containing protein [Micromonospora provocatoris]|uniref:NEAT domain-containing protein n=1 Tax=Bacillati TaxID=1783272 RepID=UPI00116CFFA7|nr:NEAT domain-containing protein [Lysinibacillus sp. CD3-6]QPQ37192.1 NEAT domain-containing protein [Lysinibacillus sp. JNUCC-52]UED81011.1 NEAT domain-containing protein [Lysinibacillus sp. CD3-6]